MGVLMPSDDEMLSAAHEDLLMAHKKVQLEADMLKKKVDVLREEHYKQKHESSRRIAELESVCVVRICLPWHLGAGEGAPGIVLATPPSVSSLYVLEMRACSRGTDRWGLGPQQAKEEKLRMYETLERELDEIVLDHAQNTAEEGEGVEDEKGLAQGVSRYLGGPVPTDPSRRMQQSVMLARRVVKLEKELRQESEKFKEKRRECEALGDEVPELLPLLYVGFFPGG